eukprot:COSAG06_NODE_38120_length_427_cov_0.746951_2_plen_30_part_01
MEALTGASVAASERAVGGGDSTSWRELDL